MSGLMGGGGSTPAPYVPPRPNPMPIEDSIKAKHEAASRIADMTASGGRDANDLGQSGSERAPAITRSDLGSVGNTIKETAAFGQQPRVRGPRNRAPSPGAGIGQSAVITG